MSEQHTSGPWTAKHEDSQTWKVVSDDYGRIVTVHEPNSELRMMNEANARLIAAAPDLLEAAKNTLEYWESTGFAECEKDCDCVVDLMRAAIAKAEGR